MAKQYEFLITCEHAGKEIPSFLENYRKDLAPFLDTHRGHDFGAFEMATRFSNEFSFPFYSQNVTRMVVDSNRSLHHSEVFSEVTRAMPKALKEQVVREVYLAHRGPVSRFVKEAIDREKTVIHIAVHSFAPVVNGLKRETDIGLLYDPNHGTEKQFARAWKSALTKRSNYKVRMNYPFRGVADGFLTSLRKKFGSNYLGFELEANRSYFVSGNDVWRNFLEVQVRALAAVFDSL